VTGGFRDRLLNLEIPGVIPGSGEAAGQDNPETAVIMRKSFDVE
jgi:hypothetical protein